MSHLGLHPIDSVPLAQLYGQEWRFANPSFLTVLWVAPIVFVIVYFISRRSRRKHMLLADENMIDAVVGRRRRWNSFLHPFLSMLVVLLMVLAVAQPQSDPRDIEVETRGRDVVFMVDVSRSMLARDVSPNRLEKTKLWIMDLVDGLGNDRVGLVAFAGSSSVLSPLTNDRLFFQLALEELSPQSVLVGGTNIGDAIRKTMELVFVEDGSGAKQSFRDIILISDGEDQESLPVEAARLAGSDGVRLITIGIGSTKGARVPWDKDSTTPRSQVVQSKLESNTLRTIAAATPGGVYLEVGTGTINLAEVYQDLIASADQRTIETTSTRRFTERYMVFIAIAVVFVCFDMVLLSLGNRKAVIS
jgi:Ca-activated chloride channel homolog